MNSNNPDSMYNNDVYDKIKDLLREYALRVENYFDGRGVGILTCSVFNDEDEDEDGHPIDGTITQVTDVPVSGYQPFHDGYAYAHCLVSFGRWENCDLLNKAWAPTTEHYKTEVRTDIGQEKIRGYVESAYQNAVCAAVAVAQGKDRYMDNLPDFDEAKALALQWGDNPDQHDLYDLYQEKLTEFYDNDEDESAHIMVKVYCHWFSGESELTLGISANLDAPYYREYIAWAGGQQEFDIVKITFDHVDLTDREFDMVRQAFDKFF